MAFVRLSAPDLDVMEKFLLDFGMIPVTRTEDRMYMRGIGPTPFLHVTEKGPAGVLSYGYEAEDESVLDGLVSRGLASRVEDLDGPGGGKRVVLQAPGGSVVEIIAGQEKSAPIPPRPSVRSPDGLSKMSGAARVARLAHTATMVRDPRPTLAWYKDVLGLLTTDELYVETEDNLLGQFLRLDRGEDLVDHHVVFVLKGPSNGMHHVSFSVEGVDDIFFGFSHMQGGSHDHVRGIGRHALGSQIFNYWMSPFGQMHEHWHSSEKMNAQSGFNSVRIGSGMAHDTGDKPPERFTKQATPFLPWHEHAPA